MTTPLYCFHCRYITAVPTERLRTVSVPYCLCGKKYDLDAPSQAFWQSCAGKYVFGRASRYLDEKTEVKVKCLVAKHSWKAPPALLRAGVACPTCAQGPTYQSQGERIIGQYLTERKIAFVHNHTLPGAATKSKRPDFRLEELKLLIEFDGSQHFKTDGRWVKDGEGLASAHAVDCLKTKEALALGYRVARIDHHWDQELPQALDQILASKARVILGTQGLYHWLEATVKGYDVLYLTRPAGEVKTEGGEQKVKKERAEGEPEGGCVHVFMKGERKGQRCGKPVGAGDRCSTHKPKAAGPGTTCPMVLTGGKRKGQVCGRKAVEDGYCQRCHDRLTS